MPFFPDPSAKATPFAGQTLVIASVSWGNVDQLALDLILTTHKRKFGEAGARRVGFFLSPSTLPVAGNDAFEPSGAAGPRMTQNSEVFQLGASGVVVLQLRAPAVRKQEEALCDEVSRWAAGEGFAQALVLAAADATMRIDAQLKGFQVRIVGNALPSAVLEAGLSLGIPELEEPAEDKRPVPEDLDIPLDTFVSIRRKLATVSGTGYTPRLLRRLELAKVPAAALIRFAFEGDNTGDALDLADAMDACLRACFAPDEAVEERAGGGLGISSGIGLADLDREYGDEDFTIAPAVPRRPWAHPPSWFALHGGPQ